MSRWSRRLVRGRLRVPLLEVEVTPIGRDEVAECVASAARGSQGLVVGNLNLHGVFLYHTDAEFRHFTDTADLVLVDGAPVALAARLSTALRVGSTDWLDAFMPLAAGLRIFAIGGTVEASAGTARHFRTLFPDVAWAAVDGYAGADLDDDNCNELSASDVVLVGMGMPRQEGWILRHRDLLEGKVVANVGGFFDYYAGVQRLAPRWIGRLGLEWLFRLASDPRRLGHRYLVEPVQLVSVLARVKRARRTDDEHSV